MNYEKKIDTALDVFENITSGTDLVRYRDILATHVNEMEKAAARCQFSQVAQHMRELGDESKVLESVLDNMVKTKVIDKAKSEKISEVISNIWGIFDDFIANELEENCQCKLRS